MADYPNSPEESQPNPEDSPQPQPPPEDDPQQSPEERLKSLQAEMAKKSEQLGNETKELAALKTDVEALAKIVDELSKAKTAFGKSLPDLNKEFNALDSYYKTKEQMVEAALGPKKKDVDAKIAEVDKKITDAKANITKLQTAADTACKLDQEAQKTLADKQRNYDDYKNLQKSLGDKFQTLKGFRAKIEEFDDKTKPASMYVILQELKKVLDTSTVPKTQAEFDAKLAEAFKKLDDAKVDARQKKLACEAAKAALAKAQSDLATLEKNRVEDILKAIEPYEK